MQAERSHRGWMAAVTVAILLTLVVLVVDKKSREWAKKLAAKPADAGLSWLVSMRGIRLASDPAVELTSQSLGKLSSTESGRNRFERHTLGDTAQRLTAPPEPVAVVVLHAPTSFPQMESLVLSPLSDSAELTNALGAALRSPMRQVSMERKIVAPSSELSDPQRLNNLALPTNLSGQIPDPVTLMRDLSALKLAATAGIPVSTRHVAKEDSKLVSATREWTVATEEALRRLVYSEGLLHPQSPTDLELLLKHAADAQAIANTLPDHALASHLMRVAYAIERRARVWYAIGACMSGGWEQPQAFAVDQVARERLRAAAETVRQKLAESSDNATWRRYLMIDELLAWSSAAEGKSDEGSSLAMQILTRLSWERLSPVQQKFLQGPEFKDLATHLQPWATQPVDYRQLLTDLELLEEDPTNRCRASLANAVQTLRVSAYPQQRMAASAINDHYRNANMRLAISADLIERLMPKESWEARPVRQRILGADTQGSSQVKTKLHVRLIPDPTAWNIELGMVGDMESATRSSKGPAVFNSTSVAKISSARNIRVDLNGLNVSADPTNVDTRQYLQSMSTDFDRLPVVGDFFRYVAREQFEQQRGVAQRIVKRMIASETDQELNRQLGQQLRTGEKHLQNSFVAPLERLGLEPIVVSMNTTEERMVVRYRVASDNQMAAHTSRPRAPSDSLLSLQLHQSSINNAINQLGLSDHAWTLHELSDKLAKTFDQAPWPLPSDVPQDIRVRFAANRPISVEMLDGKLELTLRIAELEQPGRIRLERFIIRTTYVPVAEGMQASLVREGVVSVDGPRLGMRERLPLRAIFGKVFAARPTITLINTKWASDPRTQDLAVSQIEVRDGWLGLAISASDSPHAARVAATARKMLIE